MAISAKVVGLNRLNRKFRRLPPATTEKLRRAIATSAVEVEGSAQRTIQRGSRTGVVVTRGGKRHQRSAPGEPPKTDTGRLVGSIAHDIDADGLGASVGTNIQYGPHLEFGTSKMAARPWLQPTFERLKRKIRERIAKAMRAATRETSRR